MTSFAGETSVKVGVLKSTLDNGLNIVIVRDELAPVVTTVVHYLVGSNESPAGFPGTAHAQEHMMLRGSPGLSPDELAAITAAMGGSFDADLFKGTVFGSIPPIKLPGRPEMKIEPAEPETFDLITDRPCGARLCSPVSS